MKDQLLLVITKYERLLAKSQTSTKFFTEYKEGYFEGTIDTLKNIVDDLKRLLNESTKYET